MKQTIYNTLTGKKDLIKPIKGKKINLFVCGPTVYDYSHIGHAKNYIAFDAFVKYLRDTGFDVFYLQNITDVDDRIIARAREKQVPAKNLAVAFEKEYLKDMKILGVDSVNKYARATDHIKEIINQVERLIQKEFTYIIEGDGIYFDISKFKNYGKLAGRTALDAEDAVSRIDYGKDKKNRGDFCLWKFTQQEGEPSWKSPWGNGRPGWHIEDTAITEKYFGPQYDIHGGGRDLIFPHHEAEIAQMEAVSGKSPLVKYWMHVGFLTVNGQKMSKSLGNFITIKDFLNRHTRNQLRFFVLKTLWRSPVDYSESTMMEVKSALDRIEEFLRKSQILPPQRDPAQRDKSQIPNPKLISKFKTDFYNELADDFNTPKAFAVLFDFIKKINTILDKKGISKKEADEIYKFFEKINNIFGIIDFKKVQRIIPAKLTKLAEEREKFRKAQNWQKSDKLRIEIEKLGYSVEDTNSGPVLKET